jgi:hypothetical protein
MIKDENGVYHYYHEKAAKAIEFLYSSDNEEYKKAYITAVDVMLEMDKMISDYKKLIKQYREDIDIEIKINANLNKEIREMKEGING